jgi:hypothetical protein
MAWLSFTVLALLVATAAVSYLPAPASAAELSSVLQLRACDDAIRGCGIDDD